MHGSVGEAHAVVEPVRDAQADDGDGALHTEQHAAVLRPAQLGLVHGNRRGIEPVPDTRDDAADEQLRERRGRAQQDGAQDHDGAAGEDHVLPAEALAEEEAEEAAGGAADVVDGHDDALQFGVRLVEVGGELVVGPDKPRHDALVIAEEEKALTACGWREREGLVLAFVCLLEQFHSVMYRTCDGPVQNIAAQRRSLSKDAHFAADEAKKKKRYLFTVHIQHAQKDMLI